MTTKQVARTDCPATNATNGRPCGNYGRVGKTYCYTHRAQEEAQTQIRASSATEAQAQDTSPGTNPNTIDLSPYVATIASQMGCEVDDAVVHYVNDLLNDLASELVRQSVNAVTTERKVTVSSRSIKCAVCFLFPRELRAHAISEGTNSVTRFTSNDNNTGLVVNHTEVDKFIRLVAPDYHCERFGRVPVPQPPYRRHLRFDKPSPVYFAAVLEYTMAELLEAGVVGMGIRELRVLEEKGEDARKAIIKVVNVDDMKMGISIDAELLKLFHYVSGPEKLA
jgi:hypothetical protein